MSLYKLIIIPFLLISSIVFAQSTIKHKVVSGESIYAIAKKYNVKQAEIYTLNPNIEGKLLQLNTVLLIPNNQNLSEINPKTHTVVAGESLYRISKKYNVSVQELERLNPQVVKKLPIGYELILKEEVLPVESETSIVVENEIVIDSTAVVAEVNTTNILIETALKNLGTKYKRGGTTSKGFDCSGLIFSTFKEVDITLPRSSQEQSKIGVKVDKSQAKKGDLIFFTTNGKNIINHVGMITDIFDDEIQFIHSSVQLGVIISSTKETYYSKRLKQINSVLQSFIFN
jgi:cell wall-associated NlpC family hydrolase